MRHSSDARPTVLLVEDEPLVRMLGADLLEDAGFDVIEAVNADEALSQMESHPGVQVLFTDVDMPGMDGFELARVVHDRWPDVRLVLTSGHLRPDPDDMPDDGRFIPKPYEPRAVVSMIRDLTRRAH